MESNIFGYPEKINLAFSKLRLFSEFDSGNLADAKVALSPDAHGRTNVGLFVARDCQNTPYVNSYATWFYFGIEILDPTLKVCFTVMNSNNIKSLLVNGYQIVWKSREGSWQRLQDKCYDLKQKDTSLLYSFDFDFEKEIGNQNKINTLSLARSSHINESLAPTNEKGKKIFFFAFNFPWSYEDNNRWINSLAVASLPENIKLIKSELCKSVEKREVALLTISKDESEKKGIIIISGRIHPCETASSFVLKGLVEGLISNPSFFPLLDHFVFKIIPMMNPDGVYRGYTRSNIMGQNLNRCFVNPNSDEHPEVAAFDRLVANLTEKNSIEMIIDFHSNIKKDGVFLYGNTIYEFWVKL